MPGSVKLYHTPMPTPRSETFIAGPTCDGLIVTVTLGAERWRRRLRCDEDGSVEGEPPAPAEFELVEPGSDAPPLHPPRRAAAANAAQLRRTARWVEGEKFIGASRA